MTNFDRWEFSMINNWGVHKNTNVPCQCRYLLCSACLFEEEKSFFNCREKLHDWFREEYKEGGN